MTVSIVGSSSAVDPATTIPNPTGTTDGDLIVVFGSPPADAAGFTAYAVTGFGEAVVFWKVANSEPSQWNFKASGSVANCVSLRGVTSDPSSWLQSSSLTALTAPSITGDGAVLICFATTHSGSPTLTAMPSGMTNLGYVEYPSVVKRGLAGLVAPPNPTGDRAFTGTGTYKSAIGLLLPALPASNFFAFF